LSDVTKAHPATLHPYYNFDKVMSYNATIMIVSGGRGIGKTYGAKEKVIDKALRSFESHDAIDQFIYLRRYKDEIKKTRPNFFKDIEHEYPNYDFRIEGITAQFAPANTRDEKKRPWYVMGYFIALSTAANERGVAYPMVKTIIFDEFIMEKSATVYLPNEASVFLNFYSTVDRWKDKTRVFMLSNAVSIHNPYFLEWDIKPDQVQEFTRYGNGFVVTHFPEAKDFQSSVYKTKFGQFIKDTEFATFAVANQFSDNNDHLIKVKDKKAAYSYTLEAKSGTFSVWINDIEGFVYAQSKLPGKQRMFTLDPEKMDEGKRLLTYTDKQLQVLRAAFNTGMMYFDSARTRNSLLEIFKR
jgi:hypothetical protein